MSNPFDKIKKMKGRSWSEIRARGEQAITARAERIGLSGNLPTDEEFIGLVDESFFGAGNITPEKIFERFCEDAEYNFFPAFRQKELTIEAFRAAHSEEGRIIIEKAGRAVEGKFDLLGFEKLDFGADVNWHYEPLSGKTAPLKHWKQFDELSTEETGDKKIVWELNRQQHFFDLGAAFWLTGDERYAEIFVRHLDGWMEANQPGNGVNWVSSLEVAFRVISWIWAFNFFKDSSTFSPATFWKAARFVYSHGRHIEKYLSTYYSPNTHLTGEALGLYYIGTQFPFLKAAKNWRETGAKILFDELDRQILPDGVYFEQSTWYQRYTIDFYTHFYILQTLNGDDAASENQREKLAAKIQSAMDFLMAITRPDGTTPLVGDDDGGRLLPKKSGGAPDDFRAVLSNGAVLFERGDYKFVARNFAVESLWLLGAAGARSFANLVEDAPAQKSFAFKNGGYFVMRDGWAATDNYLLVDCGELGALNGGHAHADALAVNLAVGGKNVLVDSGTYSYHESFEIRNYFRSTEAHNTLTIDDESSSAAGNKFSWKTKANAELKRWIAEERFDFFEGTHDGYRSLPNSAAHTRQILFLKNDYWMMRDFVETSGSHDYKLNFHFEAAFEAAVELSDNGNFYATDAAQSAGNVRLYTFGDNGKWQPKQSPISNLYGLKTNAPHLQFASRGAGAQEFFTFFLPVEKGAPPPQIAEVEIKGGRAFVINFRGYQDLFVFADGDQIVHTEIFNTDFRFFWARLSAGESLPGEFVLIDGKNFSLDGREIIKSAYDLEFLTARRFGNKLNMRTSESVFGISLPPNRTSA